MGKDLNRLIKYYLCSEHFEEDCFHDPKARDKLKKSKRPVKVPIPTIFKCNFDDVIPKNRHTTVSYGNPRRAAKSERESPDVIEVVVEEASSGNCFKNEREPVITLKRRGAAVEVFNVAHKLLSDEEVSIGEEEEQHTVDEIILCTSMDVCRLCGSIFDLTDDELDVIFENAETLHRLNTLMPGEIVEDHKLPKFICISCSNDLETASRIVTKFRNTQEKFNIGTKVVLGRTNY